MRITLLFLICISFLGPVVAQDWPHFGGPTRDFQSSIRFDDRFPFSAWSTELGLGDAPPIVVGGKVYVNELTFDDQGNEAVGIRCLSAASGDTIWQVTAEERSYESQDISDSFPVRPIASLCYSQGRIVSVSYGGIVSCVDAVDGRLVWKHDLVDEFQATPMQFGFASSPWCDQDKVVVACGGKQSLLKAFRLSDGAVAWSSEKGEAAFGSLAELPMPDGSRHLCYVGRDEMVGVDPENGQYLWKQELPNQGLTNAVTPVVIGPGLFVAAGQGFEGGRFYRVQKSANALKVEEAQRSSKFTPFYCNCLVAGKLRQVLTYNSGFLQGLSSDSGKVLWKQRNWTDTNCAMSGDVLLGVRGDGFVATASLAESGPTPVTGSRVINDRVWAPPVVIGSYALLRGRNSLISFDWTKLPTIDELPSGTNVDAMTAMYGNRPERIEELLKKAKSDPSSLKFDEYLSVVNDRSLRVSEGEYRNLIAALVETNPALSVRIAEDWLERDPESIMAFDQWSASLTSAGKEIPRDTFENRFVDVAFDVIVPSATTGKTEDAKAVADIYLIGNAVATGAWKGDGIKLTRADDGHYRASVRLPRGRFEFKITRGNWDTVEVKLDGRNLPNRRKRITQPTTIQATVQAWKS